MELNLEKMITEAVEKRVDEILAQKNISSAIDNTVFTANEAVDFLGGSISYGTIMRECRRGNMPCFHIGNKVYLRKSTLIKWIEEQEEKSRALVMEG